MGVCYLGVVGDKKYVDLSADPPASGSKAPLDRALCQALATDAKQKKYSRSFKD